MRRRLFSFAAAVSVVLCVGAAVLWVRSYRSSDTVGWQTLHISNPSMDSHFHGLYWSVGHFVIEFDGKRHVSDVRDLVYIPREQEGTHFVAYGFRPGDVPADYPSGWHGFLIDFSQSSCEGQSGASAAVEVPFWLLFFMTGILAAAFSRIAFRPSKTNSRHDFKLRHYRPINGQCCALILPPARLTLPALGD